MLYFRYQNGNRENWKSAFEMIRNQKNTGDLILTSNTEIGDHYLKEETSDYWSVSLVEAAEVGTPIWFVEDQTALALAPDRHTWLLENTRLVGVFDTHVQARTYWMRVYFYEP